MGGAAIPQADSASLTRPNLTRPDRSVEPAGATSPTTYGWDRLERAVNALVARQESLQKEARDLQRALDEREQRVRQLEAQILAANQRRTDTGKRIDELISQLDQLDAQLVSLDPAE